MGAVYRRKNVWWIKYRRNGRAFYESSRSRKYDDAKKLLAQREADSSRGIPVTPEIGRLKFDQVLDDLVARHEMEARRSLDKSRGRIDNHLRPAFGHRRAAEMTTGDFETYARARQKAGATNGTINRELALARRALNLARRSGKLLHVPYVPLLAEASPRTGFFTGDEIQRLLNELPAHLRPVVRFGYLTGWRLREILGLQWSNVDFDAGEVRLNMSKNGAGRVIVMTKQVRDLLREQRSLNRHVFHKGGLPITQMRRPWATACKRAKLGARRFHDLRRSAARNLVRAGVPEVVVMRLIGHKTRSMLDRYNIVSHGDLVDAAAKLEKAGQL